MSPIRSCLGAGSARDCRPRWRSSIPRPARGVLVLLPTSQILIDHIGWRGAYQLFGAIALILLPPLLLLPWRLFSMGSPHVVKRAEQDPIDEGWTLPSAMRPSRLLGAVSRPSSSPRSACTPIAPQIVAYLIDAGVSAVAGGDRLGIFRRRAAVRDARRLLARRIDRPAAVGLVQLRASRSSEILMLWALQHHPNIWLLTGFVVCFGSMIGSRGPSIDRDRHEDFSAASGWEPSTARSRLAADWDRRSVPGRAACSMT